MKQSEKKLCSRCGSHSPSFSRKCKCCQEPFAMHTLIQVLGFVLLLTLGVLLVVLVKWYGFTRHDPISRITG